MRKFFKPAARPPKPTPLPPPEPNSLPPTPATNSIRSQFPPPLAIQLQQQPHQQQAPGSQQAPTPTSVHGHPSNRPSVASQQSNVTLPRGASQDGGPDNWIVVETQDPVLVRPQPSFESRSSSVASLPPGASPPNPYPPPTAVPFPQNTQQHPQPQQNHHPYQQQQPQHQQPILPQQVLQAPPPQPPVRRRSVIARNHPESTNGHRSTPYIPQQAPTSSSEKLYEPSVMSHQEKPAKKGGIFGWVAELHETQREKEKIKYHQNQNQNHQGQDGEWDLTRIMGFVTATASEDWTLVLEVCERASANENGAREAAKALRNEFRYADPPAMLSAARLWAIMLRNTQPVFIAQCSSKKFLEDVEGALHAERTSPVVKERLMIVLAGASFHYGGDERFSGFRTMWKRIKGPNQPIEGIPFDPHDAMFTPPSRRLPRPGMPPDGQRPMSVTGMAPGTPYQTHPGMQVPMGAPPRESREYIRDQPVTDQRPPNHQQRSERDRGDRDRDRDPQHRHQKREKSHRSKGDGRYVIPVEEDIRRLFEECEIAKANAQLLSSNLTFARPENLKDILIRESHSRCMRSQELIIAQIPWATAGADKARSLQEQQQLERQQLASLSPDNDPNEQPLPPLPPTVEEELLSSLLQANQEILEAFRVYNELEALGVAEKEEREATERSKTQVRLDRTQIQYYSPDGSIIIGAPGAGGSGSRSPSPAPAPSPRSNHPLPTPPPPSIPGHAQTPVSYHAAMPTAHSNHSHGNLAPPPVAPHGPRKPSSTRSRSPSPPDADKLYPSANGASGGAMYPNGRERTGSGRLGDPTMGVESVRKGMSKMGLGLDIDAASSARPGEYEEDVQTPVKPSAKALGKRRAPPPPEEENFDADDIFKNRAGTPMLASDHGSDTDVDNDDPRHHKKQAIKYVYDAAAEREKQRQMEVLAGMHVQDQPVPNPVAVNGR